jgi:hypothetical protein
MEALDAYMMLVRDLEVRWPWDTWNLVPGGQSENVHFGRYLIILQFGTPGRQKSRNLGQPEIEVFRGFCHMG